MFYENPGAQSVRLRAHPERKRHTGKSPALTVAGSGTAAAWLSALLRRRGLSWRVERWAGEKPSGLLVLARPEICTSFLSRNCRPRLAVLPLDSRDGRKLAVLDGVAAYTFSEGRDCADLTAKDVRLTGRGLSFVAVTRTAITRITVGERELYPALAVLSCAVSLGVPLEEAGAAIGHGNPYGP